MRTVRIALQVGDLAGLASLLKAQGFAVLNVAQDSQAAYVYLEDSETKNPIPEAVRWAGIWRPITARREAMIERRAAPAFGHLKSAPVESLSNGDDSLYPLRFASFTKALPHDPLGHVHGNAYSALLTALSSGKAADFAAIPVAGVLPLRNPQAAYAFVLEGYDPQAVPIAKAPAFASAETAGEMVEIYWQAILRDVPFADYASHPDAAAAATDLSSMSDFRGPKSGGLVTPATLFRGVAAGNLEGPFISQFLLKDVSFGPYSVPQKIPTPLAGLDYLTAYMDWLEVQDGAARSPAALGPARHLLCGRDLAEWVHNDFQILSGLHAALILLSFGPSALASGIPYRTPGNQDGFVTFGPTHFIDLMARVANSALRAAWYHKWLVHRRLRPEEFGGRIQNHKTGAYSYPIHADVLDSAALARTFADRGTYLLPQSYPEGCPAHTSYPSGHATFAGACATVLKAVFDGDFVIPNPVVPNGDGSALLPWTGAPLTVRGELDKLAFNIAMGRNFAGIHWRTDASEGNRLGEAVAIGVLKDLKGCFNEPFSMSFVRFDGTTESI